MTPGSLGIEPQCLLELGISYREGDCGQLELLLTSYLGLSGGQAEQVWPDGRVVAHSDSFSEYRIGEPGLKQVYLFSNLTDLIAFYQYHRKRLGGTLLAVLGKSIARDWIGSYLAELRRINNRVRIAFVFNKELAGRLRDIQLACWVKKLDIQMYAQNGQIELKADHYMAILPVEKLSLSAFCKASGFRTNCRTVKPKSGNSYWEELVRSRSSELNKLEKR